MPNAQECARLLLETVPVLMRGIGGAVRQHKVDDETLSMGQLRMLSILSHAPRNLSELAALHHVTPSTMSRTIDVLVRKAWVMRQNDPDDRRLVILSLTDEGRAIQTATHQRMQEAFTHMIERLIEQLGEGERERLYDGLTIMQKLLAQTPADPFDCAEHRRPQANDTKFG